MKRIKLFLKKVYDIIVIPSYRILPGQLAFFFILSLIPLVTLFGIATSMLGITNVEMFDLFVLSVPEAVRNLLIGATNTHIFGPDVIWVVVLTFYLSSNGTHSMIIASNELYNLKYGNYFKRRIKALLMSFLMIVLLVFVILVPAFGSFILDFLNNFDKIAFITDDLLKVFNLLKWPFSFFFIFMFIKIIYTFAPDRKIKSSETNLGALFTTIGWIVATSVYTYYATNIANYSAFYGSISNVIILFLWVYILSYIFVLGLALNAENHLKKIEEVVR